MPKLLYALVRRLAPIACVDIVIWRLAPGGQGSNPDKEVLLIQRLVPKGSEWEAGWAIIGGRIKRGESLHDAIHRHIDTTVIDVGWDKSCLDLDQPHAVGEYMPTRYGNPGRFSYDTRQHSVALTYLVEGLGGSEEVKVRKEGEAIEARWWAEPDLRRSLFGFDQWKVLERVLGRTLPD